MTLPGIDVLRERSYDTLTGKRVGLFTNASAVTRDLTRTVDLFREQNKHQFTLAAIFTPEHGIAASAPDGDAVESSVDPFSGAAIYSLYGEHFAPTSDMLEQVNVIVCDIQDIGVRYYTYAWTISHILEAAGVAHVPVILLDRPNPLGDCIDGPLLDMQFATLVGRAPIPTQHGMTLGELMLMYNGTWNPNPCDLTVIPCNGYHRNMTWEETGLFFVPTSPAMPHFTTVRHYPGACLVEGTTLSEGRGTALPFEICGAPGIDSKAFTDHLNAQGWAGVRFRPHSFQPTAGKHSGLVCHGTQAHVTGSEFRSMKVWVGVIREARRLYPEICTWRGQSFDVLAGGTALREQIDTGTPLEAITAKWEADAAVFREQRQPYLIYRSFQ